ncbi:MAG TPA: efflux RND transporter periplasmic adaptor subunit, partial [Candidatus Eisenbacteria bacterium]|nr:efflux RND transporter periplasmic adaptor subunit [Candidatus Eisenbacteria bacterium]
TAVVWKLAGGEPRPVEVELGITDHAFTAVTRVVSGALREGDELVTRAVAPRTGAPIGGGGPRR